MDFTSGGNKQYLAHLCSGDAQVLLLQEAKDFRVADLLPAGWRALQDTSSDAKQGSALAVASGVTVGRWWMVKACDAPPGGGMLPRWLCCAELTVGDEPMCAISGHAPPPRYSSMQPGFNASVSKVVAQYPQTALVGADANMDKDKFATALGSGMKAVGKQSGICLVSRMPFSEVVQDSYGMSGGHSDHPAVWATVGAQ